MVFFELGYRNQPHDVLVDLDESANRNHFHNRPCQNSPEHRERKMLQGIYAQGFHRKPDLSVLKIHLKHHCDHLLPYPHHIGWVIKLFP